MGGRFCSKMGLKSSGPAALSCLKECMDWVMSLSFIQGKSRRGLRGAEERGGGVHGWSCPGSVDPPGPPGMPQLKWW